ncbi:MAG: hypothetical protein ISQ07_14840, partial [Pirellulales bacterium]|nr:hypothetical protein [Pirellulales bacterium]
MSGESESTTIDQLRVVRHADRQSLGQAAGQEIAAFLRERLGEQANV